MGTWGPGNFENDTAMDRLCELCSSILDDIDAVMDGDPVHLEPNEPDFRELLANLDIMTALAKHIRCRPLSVGIPYELQIPSFPERFPSLQTVDEWEDKVLACFDAFYSKGDLWVEKRAEVIRTFADMRKQAEEIEKCSIPAKDHIEKVNAEWDALLPGPAKDNEPGFRFVVVDPGPTPLKIASAIRPLTGFSSKQALDFVKSGIGSVEYSDREKLVAYVQLVKTLTPMGAKVRIEWC